MGEDTVSDAVRVKSFVDPSIIIMNPKDSFGCPAIIGVMKADSVTADLMSNGDILAYKQHVRCSCDNCLKNIAREMDVRELPCLVGTAITGLREYVPQGITTKAVGRADQGVEFADKIAFLKAGGLLGEKEYVFVGLLSTSSEGVTSVCLAKVMELPQKPLSQKKVVGDTSFPNGNVLISVLPLTRTITASQSRSQGSGSASAGAQVDPGGNAVGVGIIAAPGAGVVTEPAQLVVRFQMVGNMNSNPKCVTVDMSRIQLANNVGGLDNRSNLIPCVHTEIEGKKGLIYSIPREKLVSSGLNLL